jgi:hypothetical protein
MIQLVFGILALSIGLRKREDGKDCSEDLTLWLIIFGAIEIFTALCVVVKIVQETCCAMVEVPTNILAGKKNPVRLLSKLTDCAFGLPFIIFCCFIVAWLIVGCVWIANVDGEDDCPDSLRDWTLGLIIARVAMMAIGCACAVIILLVSCVAGCVATLVGGVVSSVISATSDV